MRFSEVIGQEEVKARLRQMVADNRVPHAMLFCGPYGCGKMATALAFASYLLCKTHDSDDDCCNECRQCAMVRRWEHPDLHFTYPTIKQKGMPADYKPISDDFNREWKRLLSGGPYFTLQQWMELLPVENQQSIITVAESDELSRKLSIKSSQGGYKVSLIWLPEKMNAQAANKLLKLLEEPPSQTVFIMVSEHPEQLLDTIISRTQRIDFRRISEDDIYQALVNQRGIDEDAARRIARISAGDWMKALEELDAGNENRLFLDMFIMLMRLAYMRNVKELKKWSENVAAFGREKQIRMLTYFMRLIRENFMYNFHQKELNYMTADEENFARNFARFIHEGNVIELTDKLQLAIRDIGQNAAARIVFFDLALFTIMKLK
ncbi:MAG: DNA polymerase III subunit delta [Prevotella sp.]|nr:DNA polymerase III subunit delta [Prevotella sp.]